MSEPESVSSSMAAASEDVKDETESVVSSSTRSSSRNAGKRSKANLPLRRALSNQAKRKAAAGSGGAKSRRSIFKKSAIKAPSSCARAVTSDRVYFRGEFFTRGDVVSVQDVESGGTFYAQIRGFLTDQYCEKSCVITWLLPTTQSPSPEEGFDPATYIV